MNATLKTPACPTEIPTPDPDRLEVLGSVITITKSDASRLSFDLEAAPGVGVPMHIHAHEDELFCVRRGKFRFVVNGHETLAGPGDTAFAPRGLPHSWEVIGTEVADAIVTVLPGNLEAMFRALAALPEGPPDFAKVAEICAREGVKFV